MIVVVSQDQQNDIHSPLGMQRMSGVVSIMSVLPLILVDIMTWCTQKTTTCASHIVI